MIAFVCAIRAYANFWFQFCQILTIREVLIAVDLRQLNPLYIEHDNLSDRGILNKLLGNSSRPGPEVIKTSSTKLSMKF